MERLKCITIILLLAVVSLASAVQDKPVSVLLQEGLYAEEVQGDLDAAIKIYEQVIAEAKEMQQVAAQATYRIGMCHLKKGEKTQAAQSFHELISKYHQQQSLIREAQKQLEKIKPELKESLFTQIDAQACRVISERYGETAEQAAKKSLYANCHIYYVDPNFTLYRGGMGGYYNWTGRTIAGKVMLSTTSQPNQTLYTATGQRLNTEILQDKTRPGHWQIYWIPEKPLAPGESLYYGWSIDDTQKVPQVPEGAYTLTMQNQFGTPVVETFFLVLPKELNISQSNPHTSSEELLNFNVYWWTRTVQKGENHVEKVTIEKTKIEYTFGPVIERTVYSEDAGKDIFFDLDKAMSFSPPFGLTRQSPLSEVLEWSRTKGIDFVNDRGHLELSEMIAVKVVEEMWDSASAAEIKDSLTKGSPQIILPTQSRDYTVSSPVTFAFETREGGIGLLQILEKRNTYLKIRYKMLQQKADAKINVSPEHIVKEAVLTISTCAESDPRVAQSLAVLAQYKEEPVVKELCKYLDSNTPNVRRSAIFILWQGGFESIAPAEEKLIKLCKHEENFTRGMSAITLGAAKISASYEILTDLTLNDSDGYVRRCAAYALGLYGDKKAISVLEKALQDKDPLVKVNAQAAITMLTGLKDSEKR